MGVLKKGRRKIMIDGREFYWYVNFEEEGRMGLVIISEDKKFNICYMPCESVYENVRKFCPPTPYIIVKKGEFKSVKNIGGYWRRFLTPKWQDKSITPAFVEKIVRWCFEEEKVTEIDFRGDIV
jgi:hypothetical protein